MTLRIMLVGLVASMGFELPSGPDLSSWTQSGREWVHARMADLSGSVVEAGRPDAGPTDRLQADPAVSIEPSVIAEGEKASDATFVEVSEAMAAEFATDLMAMRDEASANSGADAPAMLASEPLPPVGLPEGEELALGQADSVGEATQVDVIEAVDVPGESTTATDESPTRADRVSSALQLTRAAARAWADLLQESPGNSPAR